MNFPSSSSIQKYLFGIKLKHPEKYRFEKWNQKWFCSRGRNEKKEGKGSKQKMLVFMVSGLICQHIVSRSRNQMRRKFWIFPPYCKSPCWRARGFGDGIFWTVFVSHDAHHNVCLLVCVCRVFMEELKQFSTLDETITHSKASQGMDIFTGKLFLLSVCITLQEDIIESEVNRRKLNCTINITNKI